LKSQVFKRRLKASVEQVAVLRSVGRLFQALGAATENVLSPKLRLTQARLLQRLSFDSWFCTMTSHYLVQTRAPQRRSTIKVHTVCV